MKGENVLRMVGGAGDLSYAANSKIQEKAILKFRHLLEEAVGEVHKNLLPKNMVVADLGCSLSPNTFLVLSEVMRIVSKQSESLGLQPPEMQLFMNDLRENDFNNIFQSLHHFEERVQADNSAISVPHYVAGLPGSFYERLFPSQTVHLFYSSFAIMFISEVPKELENKGNLHIGKTSPPSVVKLYQEQFKRDFSLFLKLRFNELVPGGQMVLVCFGRKNKEIINSGEWSILFGLLSESLKSMVIEGLVEEEKFDSFNVPFYAPSMEEAKAVITAEGLFNVIQNQMIELKWDPYDDFDHDFVSDKTQSAKNTTKWLRSVLEPMIASHFGAGMVDEFFVRFASNVAKHLATETAKLPVIALSLKRKEHK